MAVTYQEIGRDLLKYLAWRGLEGRTDEGRPFAIAGLAQAWVSWIPASVAMTFVRSP